MNAAAALLGTEDLSLVESPVPSRSNVRDTQIRNFQNTNFDESDENDEIDEDDVIVQKKIGRANSTTTAAFEEVRTAAASTARKTTKTE